VVPHLARRLHRVRVVDDQRQRLGLLGDARDGQRRIHVVCRVAVPFRNRVAVGERGTREVEVAHLTPSTVVFDIRS